MKKRLRRVILILAAAVYGFLLSACSNSEKEQALEHLLKVWSDYLQVQEDMYTSELWALDYAEKFLDTGDWGDLV